jgi:hypothetical protein
MFCQATPQLKKAELIEGVVYMPSPVRHRRHGRPHFRLVGWLGAYEAATPRVAFPRPKWKKHRSPPRTNHSTKGKRVEVVWTNYDPRDERDAADDRLF